MPRPDPTTADPRPEDRPGAEVVEVPTGGRVLVAGDLRLRSEPSPTEMAAPIALLRTLDAWTGPGVVVLAGNTLDGPADAAMAAHPRLVDGLRRWAGGDARRLLVLPGDRDAQLGWPGPDRQAVERRLGASVVTAVDLVAETGAGCRRVRVEAGQQVDPLARRTNPCDPAETPLAHHLRADVIPALTGNRGRWLDGIERLDDPAALPSFVASRLAYRALGSKAWLVVVPVLVAVALRAPAIVAAHASGLLHHRGVGADGTRVAILAIATIVELILLAALATAALRRSYRALSGLAAGVAGREPNRESRDRARELVGEGWAGLVTGHTCRPELTDLGVGWFASVGSIGEVTTEHPARLHGLGLPPAFLGRQQVSWVELEAGSELHARLLLARRDRVGASIVERVATRSPERLPAGAVTAAGAAGPLAVVGVRPPSGDRPVGGTPPQPAVVASLPGGRSWPVATSSLLRKRRTRRAAGFFVGIAGILTLVSAVSEPLRDRLHAIRQVVPIVVPEAATVLTAIAGVALLVLARGVRRGQRRAWAVTVAVLLGTVVTDLVKGVDVEEALVALAVAVYLWINRADFGAASDRPSLRRDLLRWLAVTATVIVAGAAGLELGVAIRSVTRRTIPHHQHLVPFSLGFGRALQATVERMVGLGGVRLPVAIDRFFAPADAAAGVALALFALVLAFRPVVGRRRWASADGDRARARAVVARHGAGTLDYFALRSDKEYFFWGETVVAYAVYNGVCLVSPDPVGPVTERQPAWRAFRSFVDQHGWALGGLGAGEEWLPIYRATGMHDLYVGDEGIVRTDRFSLEGGRNKGLRQAVNRVAKYGYTISFHDPAHLDPDLRSALQDVLTKSRRGDVERGFSMTLGRAFDPEDTGLLLAVVHGPGPDGEPGPPVAFCQYVPAPGIGGYSLDLMRRDDGDHPNGLIDFAVVQTIRHLAEQGGTGLGLNFATMRAVLAGESGAGLGQRVQAWLLRRMGDSMQIESLWKFNAKFDPDWLPRYTTYDAPENALAVAIAIARAESFWELPLIGRWLVPRGGAPEDAPDAVPDAAPSPAAGASSDGGHGGRSPRVTASPDGERSPAAGASPENGRSPRVGAPPANGAQGGRPDTESVNGAAPGPARGDVGSSEQRS